MQAHGVRHILQAPPTGAGVLDASLVGPGMLYRSHLYLYRHTGLDPISTLMHMSVGSCPHPIPPPYQAQWLRRA
jgi:hypothetical protein